MGNNGNNGNNGFQDVMVNGVKALYPEFVQKPVFTASGSGNNPGVRLITNDDNLAEMLKVVWFPDTEMARNVAEALAECSEFLLNDDGKPNPEILQRIEWIKNLCAALCSYNARFADLYKQAAIGIATTAVTEKGSTLVMSPLDKNDSNSVFGRFKNNPNNNGNGKKP